MEMVGIFRGFGGRGRRRTSNNCAERTQHWDCEAQGKQCFVGLAGAFELKLTLLVKKKCLFYKKQ
jgi:hypothetical protein